MKLGGSSQWAGMPKKFCRVNIFELKLQMSKKLLGSWLWNGWYQSCGGRMILASEARLLNQANLRLSMFHLSLVVDGHVENSDLSWGVKTLGGLAPICWANY